MKKLSMCGMVALLVLGLAATAMAADVKVSGKWQIESALRQDNDFRNDSKSSQNNFDVEQRLRVAFQFIANENLKGVFETQVGANNWGNGVYQIGAGRSGSGTTAGANSAGNGNIMLRKGYIDFKWPGTKIATKVGFQTVSLPAAFGGGSPIFDDQVGAAVVSAPITDNVAILAGYARPYDNWGNGTTATATHGSSADMVFAAVPLTFSGFNVTPFGAYANIGHNIVSTTTANVGGAATAGLWAPGADSKAEGIRAYWAGAAFTMTALDPFKFMADFDYGSASWRQENEANGNGKRAGYMFDLAADYTGLKFMTPELFFAYSSGENGSSNGKSERMPLVGNPQDWTPGGFYFGDRDFINGFSSSSQDGYVRNVLGFWTVGLSLKNISFIDKLTHQINILYVQGTNNKDSLAAYATAPSGAMSYGGYLTTKDSLWEIDLNNKYHIYDQLSMYLNLGYINANFDKSLWASHLGVDSSKLSKDAYRIGLGLTYAF